MSLKQSIKSLWCWLPIIWNDRQWDYCFLFDLLKKKLELMEDFFRHRGHHVGAEKEADKIKLAIILLDRIIKDDYYDLAFKEHEKKFGTLEFDSNTLRLKHTKVTTKEQQKECDRSFSRCAEQEDYLRKQDIDMLFDLLKKNITKWWD